MSGTPLPPSAIRIRGLRKSFGEQTVLAGVDLDIGRGDNLVLFGISGSGKTVLAKCILGLMRPDAGSILIDGRETAGLPADEREALMRRIGVLFQNGALFDSLPVWQNVAFGLLNRRDPTPAADARRAAARTLASVGLGDDVADLSPAELSGGMQKRVALARAIVGEPDFLVLDDPTAGLDPILTAIIDRVIVAALDRLHATALTITHDIPSARRLATRAALLSGGRIAWEGPIEAIDRSGNDDVERFVRASRPAAAAAAGAARQDSSPSQPNA
jgi:phospholipid/cholesterol/gamma-HCH transport system ATP-binding protein